jgi:hypothetical protein
MNQPWRAELAWWRAATIGPVKMRIGAKGSYSVRFTIACGKERRVFSSQTALRNLRTKILRDGREKWRKDVAQEIYRIDQEVWIALKGPEYAALEKERLRRWARNRLSQTRKNLAEFVEQNCSRLEREDFDEFFGPSASEEIWHHAVVKGVMNS